MLHLIYGRAGAGKSEWVLSRVAEHGRALQDAILLVPEQYTFSAERLLMDRIESHGLLTVQVLSPSRLAHRVLSYVGAPRRDALDASGTQMVFTRVLRDHAGELRYYNRMRDVQSLSELMRDMIRSLRQADIRPELLLDLARRSGSDALLDKASDIALLYAAYEDYLRRGGLTDAAALEQTLIDAVGRADFLKSCSVYADGFDLIAPLTLRLLTTLAGVCPQVYVTFPCAPGRDEALFRPAKTAMDRLEAMARVAGIAVKSHRMSASGTKPPALSHLERELFAVPAAVFDDPAPQITVLDAPDPWQEAAMTAAQIVALAREKGFHYGQIAVVCADSGERARALERQLTQRGVPCRSDHMENAGEHPAVRALLGALRCAASGLTDRPTLLRVIKSGYTGLAEDDLDRFENTVLERNLTASRLGTPLDDESAEAVRAALIPPLQQLSAALRLGKTAQDYAQAAYTYVGQSGLLERVWASGEEPLARCLCTVLEQSHRLLGQMPLSGYLDALESGFAAARVGEIPQMSDAVSVSTFDRFKGDAIRALFVMGANSGLLPSAQAPQSLLSDGEREALGVYLGPGGSDYFALENLTVYGTLTQASDCICFSWAQRTAQGENLEKGDLLRRVERLFPGLRRVNAKEAYRAGFMLTDLGSARALLGPMLRRGADPKWRDVLHWFEGHEPLFAQRLRAQYAYRPASPRIAPDEAVALFGARQSISRLETFAACPYEHFMRYGLQPEILRAPALLPPDAGLFYHEALNRYTRLCAPDGFDDITPQMAAERMEQVTEPLCQALLERPFARTALGQAQVEQLRRTAIRAAVEMTWHIQHSGFTPLASEISFGMGGPYPAIEIGDGPVRLVLQGRIDRVDTARIDGQDFLRIVDYKTGRNQLSFARVETGTQLQLLTYLDAVTRRRDAHGAGAFYLRLTGGQTALGIKSPDEAELARLRRRAYRLEGIARDDPAVLQAMAPQGGLEELTNIRLKRDGTPYADAPVVTDSQMDTLLRYVRQKTVDLGARLLSGQIEPDPLKIGQTLRCQWCPYRTACPHDVHLGGKIRLCASREADARARILGSDGAPRED